jgi:hypothetical protein
MMVLRSQGHADRDLALPQGGHTPAYDRERDEDDCNELAQHSRF